MTKQSFTNVCFISSDRLYMLKSFTEMFTIMRLNFPYTWLQFINPELKYNKKSQLVTFTSAKLNWRNLKSLQLFNIVLEYVVTSKILTEFEQKQHMGTDTCYVTKINARTTNVR